MAREGWTATPGGEIYASLGDFIGRAAFFSGDLDPKLTWIAKNLIKPGNVVFDVGANLGILTLLFSKIVGLSGQVHAFEPNPNVMTHLRSAVARKSATNVILNETALGRMHGVIMLKTPESNQGEGSITKWRDAAHIPQTNVPLMRLDDYVLEHGLNRIDFLKIDVEGAEIEVLLGAQSVLKNLQPKVIVFEDSDRKGSEPTEPMKMLSSFGYRFLSIPKHLMKVTPAIIKPGAKIEGWDIVAATAGNSFENLCEALGAQ
jgi:FkbM family methyltransferase